MGWSNAGWLSDAGGWVLNKLVSLATSLDPANKGANVSLSNGNLTGTATSSANSITRSIASHTSGKYYCEVTIGTAANTAIGICNSAAALTEYITQLGTHSCGTFGTAYGGAGGTTTAPALTAGHVLGIAVDIGNAAMWIKDITAAGNWNANGTANPATNVNGATFSCTGTVYVATTLGNNADNVTYNFGATAYTGTPPAGFGNW